GLLVFCRLPSSSVLFLSAAAPTEIYTLSLHDALPICLAGDAVEATQLAGEPFEPAGGDGVQVGGPVAAPADGDGGDAPGLDVVRSEEHTSELQSRENLVCRLLLEKKKKIKGRTQDYDE